MDQETPIQPASPTDGEIQPQSTVEYYVKHLLWPTLIAGVFQIAAIFQTNQWEWVAIANATLVILTVIHVWRVTHNWRISGSVAALSGGIATFIAQTAELIFQHNTIAVFKLFTQTLTIAVFDAITASLLFLLVQTIHAFNKSNATQKGGDNND
ncbi:MAG: hypothetical protein COW24_03865 [Candidatus Kerfeldbacteria bacterium CG15_BIG_FIL_POST_REV_8_21_14_020_45_12]|uniref:Uncharacterized protein n=1 Tax=Candidatus Kerfeldbacteria bacterium CG15_BIG_FIL_POST_REV_8_21_14_020_45_12 TaxID=2014247 RepID=A0A2M7H352_9BACT|nr:MAG: hypothetical protein COW24_03865 [Candidatus Kerfeldbacteria bacterium CG15_BIG_FIL_POST_REV_8_21_14_020_45_12]PJA93545.1 MAG: hypothetical protein CO132_02850 [Candidatus Kerfeldbacteria bacterium CG_4_9_14_3_um_filter_45_8]